MKEVMHYVSTATAEPLPADKMYYPDEELGKLLHRKKRQIADRRVLMEKDPVATKYVLEVGGKITRYDAFVAFSVYLKKTRGLSDRCKPDFKFED
ncbi:hypothetical protein [Pseudolactococcus reticulitermitis]|uniref:Uncharacterized protein n=1 Tax=Pseudolactococcus reticulitermitis TaxID=2025039 RepID=A0A224XAW8_9LACT|nr:hypothetical protein [Lactococcus reticulitermitis]GAX46801.1 hypothetical protein RsY01_381 [Lactococcus reticulitermitis]